MRASSIASMPPAAVMTRNAGAFEQAGQNCPVGRAVVDDQRRQRLAGREPARRAAAAPASMSGPLGASRPAIEWQREREPAAAPGTLSTSSRPPMPAIRWSRDREAEAGASGCGAGLRLRERCKDLRERLRLDADARVADLEAQVCVVDASTLSRTSPALVNLTALPSRFSSTWRRCRPSTTTERGTSLAMTVRAAAPCALPLRRRQRVTSVKSLLRSVGRVFDVEASGLDLRQVEHVVDQIEQLRAALGDGVDRVPLCRGQGGVALQELCVAEHAVQRRAQLVAHVGQELALRARGGFCRFLRAPQLGVALAPLGDVAEERPEEVAALARDRRADGELDRETRVPIDAVAVSSSR